MAKKSTGKSKKTTKKGVAANPVDKPKVKSKYAPSRTKIERERDRREVIDYYLEGKDYREIARIVSDKRKYNISHQTVGVDIKLILNQWKSQREDKIELYITIELAKIDKLECTYWEAWDKSKQDHQQKAAKIVKRASKSEIGGILSHEETSVKHQTEFGDPRFLQGIERCIQKRIDLLGLEAAKTLNIKHQDISERTNFVVAPRGLDAPMKKIS